MRIPLVIMILGLALTGCYRNSAPTTTMPTITAPTTGQIAEFTRNASITLPASAQPVGWREERGGGVGDALWLQVRLPREDVQALLDASPFHGSKFSTNDEALVFQFQDVMPTPPVRYRCAFHELPNARFVYIIIDESDATNAVVYLLWHEP